jgi:hypothetical protein
MADFMISQSMTGRICASASCCETRQDACPVFAGLRTARANSACVPPDFLISKKNDGRNRSTSSAVPTPDGGLDSIQRHRARRLAARPRSGASRRRPSTNDGRVAPRPRGGPRQQRAPSRSHSFRATPRAGRCARLEAVENLARRQARGSEAPDAALTTCPRNRIKPTSGRV